jgi:hypothetical protein
MNTNTPDQLKRRAALLVQAAASSTTAKSHLDMALIHARAARADLGVLHELETAVATIDRATQRAEQQRLRLLRKADRQGENP